MRKFFTLFNIMLLSLTAVFAQPQIPSGYVSVYSIKPETERAPVAIAGGASNQLLGPASGWGASTEYDFSNYEKLSLKITFDPADAGHQVAIRMSVNTVVKLQMVTLPTSGTTFTEEINLLDLADANGKILIGGIVFYNGASHFSFSYDGTPSSSACTIEYIALKIKVIPDGYVSVYSIKPETDITPLTIAGAASSQVLGPASGWGTSTEYDFSNYEKLAFKITFDPADAGHQMAIRMSINTSVVLHVFTLPATGTTTVEEINLPDYANADGQTLIGGIVFYNGATHWSFSYDGTPASSACTIEYIALKKKPPIHDIPEGYVSIYSVESETELAPLKMDSVESYQLLGSPDNWGSSLQYDLTNYEKLAVQIAFDQADTGKQVAFRFSINGYTYLHLFNLPKVGEVDMEEINLDDYADANGKIFVGGIVFYNGATHWSFSYTDPATKPATIDFVALKAKSVIPTGVKEISVEGTNPDALVDVYSIMGTLILKNVKYSEAVTRLEPGLYIIGHKKVYITR